MRVLYFASEYLPYNNTGTFRTVKFVKAFNKQGIPVRVITLQQEAAKNIIGEVKCDGSLETVSDVPIHRIISFPLFQYLFTIGSTFKNIQESDFSLFFKEIKEIVDEFNPNIIIATYPHSATIKLSSIIAKKFDLPFVIDMRDTWSYWPFNGYRTYFHYLVAKFSERKLFMQANSIITVTPEVKEIFIKTHGEFLREKIHVVYNSFSNKLLQVPVVSRKIGEGSKIVIGYVGTFYYSPEIRKQMFSKWYKRGGAKIFSYFSSKEDWLYRSPYFFLESLFILLKKHPSLREHLTVDFIGRHDKWLTEMVEHFNLNDICIVSGFLSKDKLDYKISSCDYLLATSEKVIQGRSYCLPSKLFEYLQWGKPILGFVTEGVQKDFLNNCGVSIQFNPDDPKASAEGLEKLFNEGFEGRLNYNFLQQFAIESTSTILIKVLKKLL